MRLCEGSRRKHKPHWWVLSYILLNIVQNGVLKPGLVLEVELACEELLRESRSLMIFRSPKLLSSGFPSFFGVTEASKDEGTTISR